MRGLGVILALLTLLLNCRQDLEPQLPPATQTGQHTFGCLIDGQVFVPGGKQALFEASLTLVFEDSVFDIRANYDRYRRYIGIFRQGVFQPGVYQLTQKNSNLYYDNEDSNRPCKHYSAGTSGVNSSVQGGRLTITRLSGGVVSGRFEFTLISPQCDTVRITDGRFDYRL